MPDRAGDEEQVGAGAGITFRFIAFGHLHAHVDGVGVREGWVGTACEEPWDAIRPVLGLGDVVGGAASEVHE